MAIKPLYDRVLLKRVEPAETIKGGSMEFDVGIRHDEAVYRVASLFFDADQAARSLAAIPLVWASLACGSDSPAELPTRGALLVTIAGLPAGQPRRHVDPRLRD